jgi:hypothetical protein
LRVINAMMVAPLPTVATGATTTGVAVFLVAFLAVTGVAVFLVAVATAVFLVALVVAVFVFFFVGVIFVSSFFVSFGFSWRRVPTPD